MFGITKFRATSALNTSKDIWSATCAAKRQGLERKEEHTVVSRTSRCAVLTTRAKTFHRVAFEVSSDTRSNIPRATEINSRGEFTRATLISYKAPARDRDMFPGERDSGGNRLSVYCFESNKSRRSPYSCRVIKFLGKCNLASVCVASESRAKRTAPGIKEKETWRNVGHCDQVRKTKRS